MLHLRVEYAEQESNMKLVERGVRLAAENGADWITTPELTFTGYRFDLRIGTDWIPFGPDRHVQKAAELAAELKVTLFLSHLEKVRTDSGESKTYNTLFVVDETGIVARHRKINTIPVAEAWSDKGNVATVVPIDEVNVGLLICADAWPEEPTQSLQENGAELIISSANWAPGKYGPGDIWEKRSAQSGLPFFVNNRTGREREFDLSQAVSVISHQGNRVLTHQSTDSKVVLIEWDTARHALIGQRRLPLQ
ncbi:MAG: carbon-nitrogen hydrolase family protein [Pseudomonadota bacterium]